MMKILCISGHAQHGKDTSALIMQKMLWGFGDRTLIVHNADLLKFMCSLFFSWNGNKDEDGRTLLQYVGTDIVRSKEPDYWVEFIAHALDLFNDCWDYVLIPDCRFPNEIDVMKKHGFDVIHINIVRNNFDNGLTNEQKQHASETALDNTKPDITINNDGNIVDLTREIISIIYQLHNGLTFML